MYIDEILRSNGELSTKDLIEQMRFLKLKRSIDRQKLKLKMNTVEEHHEDVEGEIDGVKLCNLHKWLRDDTLVVSKILKHLLSVESCTIEELKDAINYEGSASQLCDNIDSGKSLRAQYGELWIHKNNITKINPKIKEYIDL